MFFNLANIEAGRIYNINFMFPLNRRMQLDVDD